MVELLSKNNIDKLIKFELEARNTEREVFLDDFHADEYKNKIIKCLGENDFINTKVLLSYDNDKVVGRIDIIIFHSLMDGTKRGYIDWVYVLKEYRHKKVAQGLFKEAEKYLKDMDVNDYFLIVARNKESQNFYHSFNKCNIETNEILSKEI